MKLLLLLYYVCIYIYIYIIRVGLITITFIKLLDLVLRCVGINWETYSGPLLAKLHSNEFPISNFDYLIQNFWMPNYWFE